MGLFQVMYDSRVVIYDCRAFIRLTTGFESSFREGYYEALLPDLSHVL